MCANVLLLVGMEPNALPSSVAWERVAFLDSIEMKPPGVMVSEPNCSFLSKVE